MTEGAAIKNRVREVTGILAEMDVLFEFGRTDPEQKHFWALAPFSEKKDRSDAVPVMLLLDEGWLSVFHLAQLKAPLTEAQVTILLVLNTELAFVKVGLAKENEDENSALWVGQQIPVSQINLEVVKIAIGAVTVGAREAKRRLDLVKSTLPNKKEKGRSEPAGNPAAVQSLTRKVKE
ncbi:MAG: hypothetical protein ACLQBA_14200 [Candidatus Binataceae bacterium]